LASLDKFGFIRTPRYRLRNGLQFTCRGKTTDLDEVVVVCSGREYPFDLVLQLPIRATVVDIGAHIGSFSVSVGDMLRDRQVRGWSIEPYPPNASLLRTNLADNNVNFHVAEVAISTDDGSVLLDDSVAQDAVRVTQGNRGIPAKAQRLSTFCQENGIDNVDLLKLDIEGHEHAVFEADGAFIGSHVGLIMLECHPTATGNRETLMASVEESFWLSNLREVGPGVLVLKNRSFYNEH
jgi:FkbM family methyltransferase